MEAKLGRLHRIVILLDITAKSSVFSICLQQLKVDAYERKVLSSKIFTASCLAMNKRNQLKPYNCNLNHKTENLLLF